MEEKIAYFEEIIWTITEPISIRDYASYCGFNLNTINLLEVPDQHRRWIERKIVSNILSYLDKCWEDNNETSLRDVEKGVYVISLAGNICIEYKKNVSQVIYIGRGKVRQRIYNHLKNWVTNFSESLNDIKFKFWITEIKKSGLSDAFKIVESKLIDKFVEKNGELPILNKKYGDGYKEDQHIFCKELTMPLTNERGIKRGWKISPMENNEWFKEIEDEI